MFCRDIGFDNIFKVVWEKRQNSNKCLMKIPVEQEGLFLKFYQNFLTLFNEASKILHYTSATVWSCQNLSTAPEQTLAHTLYCPHAPVQLPSISQLWKTATPSRQIFPHQQPHPRLTKPFHAPRRAIFPMPSPPLSKSFLYTCKPTHTIRRKVSQFFIWKISLPHTYTFLTINLEVIRLLFYTTDFFSDSITNNLY